MKHQATNERTSIAPSDETFWQAVLNRDEQFDGAFVYGVLSTRIFCRPSCPSRRPQRSRVRFFVSQQDAVLAGFRACKRCRPLEYSNTRVQRVQRTCQLIEASSNRSLSLAELSSAVGSSPHHLQRTFKQVTGLTPREYADALRIRQLKTRLNKGDSVINALYETGYGSSRALYERAPAQLGMTPATYGRGGKGACIRWDTAPCPFGLLLVAATSKGVCSVALGSDEAELEAALHREFPAAQLQKEEGALAESVGILLQHMEGQTPHIELPLDVQATAFQWQVWQALRAIGYGQTRSYAQIAQEIGQPRAVRAVARACATNPVALVVPCHRVLRSDGSLSGYRWGLERKRELLKQEQLKQQKQTNTVMPTG